MCMDSAPAIATGIGEQLKPFMHPLPELFALLVHPRVPLLTADVYRAFTLGSATAPVWDGTSRDAGALMASLRPTRNDLQAAAIQVDARVAEVLLALETVQPAPALVRMSGSGACCFALYSKQDEAAQAAKNIAQYYPDWWVQVTRI